MAINWLGGFRSRDSWENTRYGRIGTSAAGEDIARGLTVRPPEEVTAREGRTNGLLVSAALFGYMLLEDAGFLYICIYSCNIIYLYTFIYLYVLIGTVR